MAGFIVLNDGRAWAAANWAYDAAVRSIARALRSGSEANALGAWLLDQTCETQGAGLGHIDIRELTPKNQSMLVAAIRRAVADHSEPAKTDFADADIYPAWLDRFAVLVPMIESLERGEPPMALNPHMDDVIPATGRRSGPGWEVP